MRAWPPLTFALSRWRLCSANAGGVLKAVTSQIRDEWHKSLGNDRWFFGGYFFGDLIKYCLTFSSKTEFLITYGDIFLGLPVHWQIASSTVSSSVLKKKVKTITIIKRHYEQNFDKDILEMDLRQFFFISRHRLLTFFIFVHALL